jgi:hypothetical protein
VTEDQWLSCTDPQKMLRHLGANVSDRKLRLFACACCRRNWHQLTHEALRGGIETAEQFADGRVSDRRRGAAFAAAKGPGVAVKTSPLCVVFAASLCPVRGIRYWIHTIAYQSPGGSMDQHSSTADLMREVVGNPFRRPSVPARCLAWDDGLVVKLAQGIYEERAYDRLPVLADALDEAGCADEALLAHLRGPGPHVRGCWALGLILGKE